MLCYGHTGSGKTHTMFGTGGAGADTKGAAHRTVATVFKRLSAKAAASSPTTSHVRAACLEIYNEQLTDLLAAGAGPSSRYGGAAASSLEIRRGADGTAHVPGLVWANVGSADDAIGVLKKGERARTQASTKANHQSSRSHCVLILEVAQQQRHGAEGGGGGGSTTLRIFLVDLAGSERLTKTGAAPGSRAQREGAHINKSLLALGDVLEALSTRASHVPFRNSKLTYLLQEVLSGEARCAVLLAVSPQQQHLAETQCTLQFGIRARKVVLGAARTVDVGQLEGRLAAISRSLAQPAALGAGRAPSPAAGKGRPPTEKAAAAAASPPALPPRTNNTTATPQRRRPTAVTTGGGPRRRPSLEPAPPAEAVGGGATHHSRRSSPARGGTSSPSPSPRRGPGGPPPSARPARRPPGRARDHDSGGEGGGGSSYADLLAGMRGPPRARHS